MLKAALTVTFFESTEEVGRVNTMRATVVFESLFGNTHQIACAVAEGLGQHLEVEVVEVGQAPRELDTASGLLVLGGPTHAFGMSRPATRDDARKTAKHAVVSNGIGIREWLAGQPHAQRTRYAAAFDTRVKIRGLPGSAARGAARALRRHGYELVLPPESFYVADTPGPLRDGELDRARSWGERLGLAYTSQEALRPIT